MMIDRWGRVTRGMTQNLIPTGNPEVTFVNLEEGSRAVYVIVDDPQWMSVWSAAPFSLRIDRSWDPGLRQADATPIFTGIWALTGGASAPDADDGAGAPAVPD